jgi:lysozyme family protein
MADLTASQVIDNLIEREGSVFSNHPADIGGPTKFGVTIRTLSSFLKRPATVEDVAALTEDTARQVYALLFVREPGFSLIDDDILRELVIDSGVQHGPGRAQAWLATLVQVDPKLGAPALIAAINAQPSRKIYADFLARRCEFYGEIITHDHVREAAQAAGFRLQAENAHGWARRLAEFIRQTAAFSNQSGD